MGLLSTEVEVRLSNRNVTYYRNLGYKIPRYYNGVTINVKTSDLSPKTDIVVDVECDCCNKVLQVKNSNYTRYNHNGEYYCSLCSLKIFHSGENNSNWNPNKTDEEREDIRIYSKYLDFVQRVLARDNYTCQCCGKKSEGDMEVHHLDGYNWCKEKRTDDTNAITLCTVCHANFHSKYGKGNNTKEQYEEWIGYTIGELEKYDGILPTVRKIFDYERNQIFDSANQYENIFGVSAKLVRRCCSYKNKLLKENIGNNIKMGKNACNTIKGHHLFWLDEYKNMTQEEIKYILSREKGRMQKIICLTTSEIFGSSVIASKQYGINKSSLCECCNGKKESCGTLNDGKPLRWMKYQEFLQLPQEEQKILLNNS